MISEKNLIKKDLNLLLVLVVLYKERNTERAAERLFVTQSAISKGLKKLREQLDDPLFVRTRNGFIPTSFCEDFVSKIEPILLSVEQVYSRSNLVRATDYRGELSIAISAAFGYGFTERLYKCLYEDFPNATLNISIWTESTESNLLDGRIQLGINYSPIRISNDLKSKHLRRIGFKFVTRKNHPLSNQPVKIDDMIQYPFVAPITPSYTNRVGKFERVTIKRGLPVNVILRSDNQNVCMACIKRRDAIMLVNDLTAKALSKDYSVLNTEFEPSEYVPNEFAAIYYSDLFSTTELSNLVETSIRRCLSFAD